MPKDTSSHSPRSAFLLTLLALASFLGFILFVGFVFVMLGVGSARPTFEMKRAQERLEKLKVHQARDKELLETYGWVNESAGIPRLPIERAMELTVQDLAKKEVKAAGLINPPAETVPAPASDVPVAENKPAPAAPTP